MNRLTVLFVLTGVFLIGFASASAISWLEEDNSAVGIGTLQPEMGRTQGLVAAIAGSAPQERPSPADRIQESQIHVLPTTIIIDLPNAEWATFPDTNSMDPIIDKGANAIEIVPSSPDQIDVGDIISYRSEYSSGIIIHRVIEKGSDNEGDFFILKGDNNDRADPGKVRFDQIERIVVAIIY